MFSRLKNDCSKEVQAEYEEALRRLVERYNTTIYENRFIVGGAVEVFTGALLRSVGIECTVYSNISKSGDILLPNDRKLSIKATFTGGVTDVRLLNKMGEGERVWDTATLFVVANVGIVFGTPDMVENGHVKDVKDAVILKKSGLKLLTENDANVFPIAIPQKPATEKTGFSYKASAAVAHQILFETQCTNLLKTTKESYFWSNKYIIPNIK